MKTLCLDLGEKRIGIAVSDETGTLARSLAVVQRSPDEGRRILELARESGAGQILFGLPVRPDGSMSAQTEKTLAWVEQLKKQIPLPFISWDERYTTREAENILLTADLSRKKRKKYIDRLAAQIILQDYLDAQKPPPAAPESERDW